MFQCWLTDFNYIQLEGRLYFTISLTVCALAMILGDNVILVSILESSSYLDTTNQIKRIIEVQITRNL